MQEMWQFVVVHAHCHAPHQLYVSQDCTAQTRFCRICHTSQSRLYSYNPTSSKINNWSTCVVWKKWTRNSNYNPDIFSQAPSLCVVLGQPSRLQAVLYMNYGCHNDQAQPNLIYCLGTICHTTYNMPSYPTCLTPPSWKRIFS